MRDIILMIATLSFMTGLIAAVFVAPGFYNIGLIKLSRGDNYIPFGDKVKCFIPIYGYYYSWYEYNGSISIMFIGSIVSVLSIILRWSAIVMLAENVAFNVTTTIIMLAVLVVYYIICIVTIFSVLTSYGIYNFTYKVFLSSTVIFGMFAIGLSLPRLVTYYDKDTTSDLYAR